MIAASLKGRWEKRVAEHDEHDEWEIAL